MFRGAACIGKPNPERLRMKFSLKACAFPKFNNNDMRPCVYAQA